MLSRVSNSLVGFDKKVLLENNLGFISFSNSEGFHSNLNILTIHFNTYEPPPLLSKNNNKTNQQKHEAKWQ